MGYLGTKPSNQTPTYKLKSEFVATAGQTVFAPSAYTPGYIDVYRNGVKLGNADFTATNGTTVTLAAGASAGDLITFESVYLASIQNGIPATAGAVSTSLIADNAVTAAKMGANGTWAPAGTVLQVVNAPYNTYVSTTSTSFVDTGMTASITPKFANSKILVCVSLNSFNIGSTAPYMFNLTDGSNNQIINLIENQLQGSTGYGGASVAYFHSPGTVSSFTYKVRYKVVSTGTVYFNNYNSTNGASMSSITLMEIAQ